MDHEQKSLRTPSALPSTPLLGAAMYGCGQTPTQTPTPDPLTEVWEFSSEVSVDGYRSEPGVQLFDADERVDGSPTASALNLSRSSPEGDRGTAQASVEPEFGVVLADLSTSAEAGVDVNVSTKGNFDLESGSGTTISSPGLIVDSEGCAFVRAEVGLDTGVSTQLPGEVGLVGSFGLTVVVES